MKKTLISILFSLLALSTATLSFAAASIGITASGIDSLAAIGMQKEAAETAETTETAETAEAANKPSSPRKSIRTATQKMVDELDGKGGKLNSSVWGILAINMKGDTIAALNQHKLMVPASNMKLITTAGALLKLGTGYSFGTSFATDGEIADSTLIGNLYIIGNGDPTLGNLFSYLPSEDYSFGRWKGILEKNGIKSIQGDIVGDGSHFAASQSHTDWSTEDIRTKDGVTPSGLTWRGMPTDSLPDGPMAAAWHYLDWLQRDSSIAVSGCAREMDPTLEFKDSLRIIGRLQSPPLKSLVNTANRQSDNFIAETLIKELGLVVSGSDTYGKSTESLKKALSPIGMYTRSKEMRFADGSGLSRKNYISPEFIVGVLRGMANSKLYSIYRNSLPRPGYANGTLKNRLPKAPASTRERIWMKSGSMNGNRCFSGYIDSSDGKFTNTIVFSVMVNNFPGNSSELAKCLDELVATLAAENE